LAAITVLFKSRYGFGGCKCNDYFFKTIRNVVPLPGSDCFTKISPR
jgi:hypothetical protein